MLQCCVIREESNAETKQLNAASSPFFLLWLAVLAPRAVIGPSLQVD